MFLRAWLLMPSISPIKPACVVGSSTHPSPWRCRSPSCEWPQASCPFAAGGHQRCSSLAVQNSAAASKAISGARVHTFLCMRGYRAHCWSRIVGRAPPPRSFCPGAGRDHCEEVHSCAEEYSRFTAASELTLESTGHATRWRTNSLRNYNSYQPRVSPPGPAPLL